MVLSVGLLNNLFNTFLLNLLARKILTCKANRVPLQIVAESEIVLERTVVNLIGKERSQNLRNASGSSSI
jgi:hypothetical protein